MTLSSAILDRLLFRCETVVIEGKSYRAKDRVEEIQRHRPLASADQEIPVNDAQAQIRAKVQMIVADNNSFGVLSTGERIAVALFSIAMICSTMRGEP